MKFRLLDGRHFDNKRMYAPGDIVESDVDLAKAFNSGTHRKFEKLYSNEQLQEAYQQQEQKAAEEKAKAEATAKEDPDKPNFDTMSVKQITAWAAANEVDLSEANGKSEMVAICKRVVG